MSADETVINPRDPARILAQKVDTEVGGNGKRRDADAMPDCGAAITPGIDDAFGLRELGRQKFAYFSFAVQVSTVVRS